MGAPEGLQPQREGWDFIEVFQSLSFTGENFNRERTQSPGDASARSSPATASKQEISVPLKLFEMQIHPRNAPLVNFIYVF